MVLNQLLDSGEHGIGIRDKEPTLDMEALQEFGLSSREIRELIAKLEPVDRPSHDLDLSMMRKAEDVAKDLGEAVPKLSDSK